MPVAITIRHVPDEVRNDLASQAAARGWSLQEFLLSELVRLSERPKNAELIGRAREGLVGPGPSIEQILKARDDDRR